MEQTRQWETARDQEVWAQKWTPLIAQIDDMALTAPVFGVIEERFRQIAARCLDTSSAAGSQSVAISSATVGEGKSAVSIGIAAAAARNLGSDVLLLETDLRRPTLANDFRLDTGFGLAEYLAAEVELEPIIQATRMQNVWLLPAGRPCANPGPLLRSQKFQDLMKTLHGNYSTIILDVPPLLTSPHAAVIANQAEGLVLVARAGRTHIQDAAQALKAAGDVPVRGVVLNGTREWIPGWIARFLGVSRFAIE
ncbi:MAG TPA: CpsD/CapB family tyrosine-protein kinase [Dehalococcoidia bacterium]|jgi:capsular exopolysaccharide synthesis family protein